MKKLIPYFAISGEASYPDDYQLFSQLQKVSFNNADYWLCEYTGELDLETGEDNYETFNNYMANKTGIRKIAVASFYARLAGKLPQLLALSDQLAAQGSYELKADLMKLDKSEFVDLDDPRLKPGLNATGQFTEEELTAIFADGQPGEVPEILK